MAARSPREIKEAGDRYVNLMADIMGIEVTDDVDATRTKLHIKLGVKARTTFGEHPPGRASTLDELMAAYLNGEFGPIGNLPEWADENNFHWDPNPIQAEAMFYIGETAASEKIFTQILFEEFDLANAGTWVSRSYGGYTTTEPVRDPALIETCARRAGERYEAFWAAFETGYAHLKTVEGFEEPFFGDGELSSLLG